MKTLKSPANSIFMHYQSQREITSTVMKYITNRFIVGVYSTV